jgi:hypothetical protein
VQLSLHTALHQTDLSDDFSARLPGNRVAVLHDQFVPLWAGERPSPSSYKYDQV